MLSHGQGNLTHQFYLFVNLSIGCHTPDTHQAQEVTVPISPLGGVMILTRSTHHAGEKGTGHLMAT